MTQNISLDDLELENVPRDGTIAKSVNGNPGNRCRCWGFAASTNLSEADVRKTAKMAVNIAKQAGRLTTEPIELAPEPVHANKTYVSSYAVNPFEVPLNENIDLLNNLARPAHAAKNIAHVDFTVRQFMENKFFANLEGTQLPTSSEYASKANAAQ